MPDELLTTAQAAERLGRSVATINRWAAAGRLAVRQKLPGRTGDNLYSAADVDAQRGELAGWCVQCRDLNTNNHGHGGTA